MSLNSERLMEMITRNIINKFQKHPLAGMAILFISIFVVMYYILTPQYDEQIQLMKQQHLQENEAYERKLADVQRGLRLDSRFDITKILVDIKHINEMGSSLHYFEKENFYASKNVGGYKYEERTASNFLKNFFPLDTNDTKLLEEIDDNMGSFHIWSLPKETIKFKLGQSGDELSLSPRIILNFISHDIIIKNLEVDLKIQKNMLMSGFLMQYFYENFRLSKHDNTYLFTTLQLKQEESYVFIQSLETYKKCIINNKYVDIYQWRESFYIPTSKGIYIFEVSIPTIKYFPDQKILASTASWFDNLKIIKSF